MSQSSTGNITSPFTLFINCYSIKYSKTDGLIRVTMPGFATSMNESDRTLSAELLKELKELSWSERAITQLEKLLFGKDWETCLRLNPKTGKLSQH